MHASLQTFDWQQAIESSSIFDLIRLAFQPRLQPTNLAIPQNVHPRLVVLILYAQSDRKGRTGVCCV